MKTFSTAYENSIMKLPRNNRPSPETNTSAGPIESNVSSIVSPLSSENSLRDTHINLRQKYHVVVT